jgi:UDP-N-acetylmuramyl tripeptide synthase
MEPVDCSQPFTVVVDYAHTPDALDKALETLSRLTPRIIAVLVVAGSRPEAPMMESIAARRSDRVVS